MSERSDTFLDPDKVRKVELCHQPPRPRTSARDRRVRERRGAGIRGPQVVARSFARCACRHREPSLKPPYSPKWIMALSGPPRTDENGAAREAIFTPVLRSMEFSEADGRRPWRPWPLCSLNRTFTGG